MQLNGYMQGRSEDANAGVGGVMSHLPTTFQSLINLSFPKIVGEWWGRGGGKTIFRTYHFSE
jgi:hypothetical protein